MMRHFLPEHGFRHVADIAIDYVNVLRFVISADPAVRQSISRD